MNTKQNMNTFKWNNIPWVLIEKYILQIQNRIYYAEKKNDKKHIYVLQNQLSKSWSLQTKNFFELFFMGKNIKQLNPSNPQKGVISSNSFPVREEVAISSFSFFFSKKKKKTRDNVNELRELLETSFPFFYNNENIRNKIFSIFFDKKSGKRSKKKSKFSSLFLREYSNKARKYLSNFSEFFVDRSEINPSRIPITLTNSKDQNSILLNTKFFIMKLIVEKQHSLDNQIIGKFYLNDCKNYEIIKPRVSGSKMMSLNSRTGIRHFFSLSLLFFFKSKKTEKRHNINKKFIKKFFNWFIDYKTSSRVGAPVFARKILFEYYQFQFLQHFFICSTSPMYSNIGFRNLTFKNSIFFIISHKNLYNNNNKKDEIRSHKFNHGWVREFDILLKKKIDFYRKSQSLIKKLKSLLQILSLTEDFSALAKPFFLIRKTNDQIPKNSKSFKYFSPFKYTYSNEKMSFLEIKKNLKLARIKNKIEPQWQARYECYSYSLNNGSSAFKKIEAIYKNICDQPKFLLKIELKSLLQDLFIEQIHDKRQDNFSLSSIHQFENFVYLLKKFFFYGLEKEFFHILKKQYFNISNSFFKQTIIFDKNQILILHGNDIFLKQFCQFLFSSFLFIIPFFSKKKKNYQVFFFNFEKRLLETSRFLLKKKKHTDNSIVDFKENVFSIKTKIVHSFMPYEKNPPGIDFLGFYINQLNKKQYLQKNIDLEYFKKPAFNVTKFNIQTFIAPSLSNVRNHLMQIKTIIKQSKTSTQELLITRLSPKIRGWSKFYSQTFFLFDKRREYLKTAEYCDYLTFKMLWRWACRRHPNKNRTWVKLKYFKTLHEKNWVFCVTKKIESRENSSSHNSALISLEKNSEKYFTSLYLCLPLHREI